MVKRSLAVAGPQHAAMISELAMQRYVGGRIISLEADAATRFNRGFMSLSLRRVSFSVTLYSLTDTDDRNFKKPGCGRQRGNGVANPQPCWTKLGRLAAYNSSCAMPFAIASSSNAFICWEAFSASSPCWRPNSPCSSPSLPCFSPKAPICSPNIPC